jgi:hypothetical protein
MSAVATYSYTHSVTFVADNILKSLKDVIRLAGLDPSGFVRDWETNLRALKAWLESGDLERVVLEIYHPTTDALLHRWDVDISYGWSDGDGSFWVDTDQIRYAMAKAGVAPSTAKYDLMLKTKPGRPEVAGWGTGAFRSTSGMVRHALGSTVEHGGLGASAAYWRRA